MKMENLINQRVKLSPRSITCKDENGKTVGIVTGAENFRSLRPNRNMDYFHKIKSAGLWGNGESENVYIVNGKLYYLQNLKRMEFYASVAGKPCFERETENYKKMQQLAENVAKIGTVIPCYILK